MRGVNLTARFCRSVSNQPCQTLPPASVPLKAEATRHTSFTWIDRLPPELTQGNPRLLTYRVELLNASGRAGDQSEPAFTSAGAAPTDVLSLTAQGSRLGIVLDWQRGPHDGNVVIERQNAANQSTVQLTTPAGSSANSLLDTSAKLDMPYRYTAARSLTVQLGERSIELRSSPSISAEVTLKAIYPPPAATGLTAAPFASAASGAFAVDLIWQPVDDAGLITALAGYNVYRAEGDYAARRLNASPVTLPAFHDSTAVAGVKYRYRVTAVDVNGRESLGVLVDVGP